MSLMLDGWPADEAPPQRRQGRQRRPERVWPWLTGVSFAVAIWAVLLGVNPFQDIDSLALVAIPSALALVGVALLARTTLPGWAIALAHFVVLPLALLIPLGVFPFLEGSFTEDVPVAVLVYTIGCIWAATALIVCGLITVVRLLVSRARRGSDGRVSCTTGSW